MLLDTSGLLCLLLRDEPLHSLAIEHYQTATRRVIHNYILAEFIALASSRRLPRETALRLVNNLARNRGVELVWVDPGLHLAGMTLLASRPDKDYSLCDAVSFLVMRARRISVAFSTDHHFEQDGFHCLLGPQTT